MHPVSARAWRMPTEAEEDWMMAVSSVPASSPISGLRKETISSRNWGTSRRGETAPLIISIPYISRAKPRKMTPTSCFFSLLDSINRRMPPMAHRSARLAGLSIWTQGAELLTPARLRIQAVTVVPMLAPMMTPTDWESFISPELTSPTSMTVTAEEDCTTPVTKIPRIRPRRGLPVIRRRISSMRLPASLVRDWDIIFIP